MGYSIIGGESRKLMDESYDNVLSHISCQYSYKELLNESFGFDIVNFQGDINKSTEHLFVKGIENMISKLEDSVNHQPIFPGYIGAIEPNEFIKELLELKLLILAEKVKYLEVY